MPLYEYRCTACGYSFEKIQSFSATPESECPKCGGVLIRPVTAPALRFEGAGWYVNDYAGKGGSKSGSEAGEKAASTEATAAADAKGAESAGKETKGTAADKGGTTPAAPAAPASSSSSSATS